MPEPTPLQFGHKLRGGRYTLLKLLGRGSLGEVWLARDERLDELVALKFVEPEISRNPQTLDRLRRQIARSQKLTQINIVRVYDLHEEPGEPAFIAMEYVDGATLVGVCLLQPQNVLRWPFLRPLVGQLCAALEYAHAEGVVHGNLKPGNLMVDGRHDLKVGDFGISGAADGLPRNGLITAGNLPYLSPQQLAGHPPQVTDDIYSVGAALYELATTRPPFYGEDVRHQITTLAAEPIEQRLDRLGISNPVPPAVAAVILACLSKEPSERPPSARALAERLELRIEPESSSDGLAGKLFGAPASGTPENTAGASSIAGTAHGILRERFIRNRTEAQRTRRRVALMTWGLATLVLLSVGAWRILRHRDRRLTELVSRTIEVSTAGAKATANSPAVLSGFEPLNQWTNSLGMVFVPVPRAKVLFSVWDTRVSDFRAFAESVRLEIPRGSPSWSHPGFEQGPTHPVCLVSWDEAVRFCRWLTAREIRKGLLDRRDTYRLPRDAEWSVAVGDSRYPWGDEWVPLYRVGRYKDGSIGTWPVGGFPPNQYGLFDMGGNVFQWCEETYRKEMNSREARTAVPWLANDVNARVVRGASWHFDGKLWTQSQFHGWNYGGNRADDDGFRCVLEVHP